MVRQPFLSGYHGWGGKEAHRIAQKDLGDEEGVVLAEISLVENQQEFDTIIQGLNGMGNATRRLISLARHYDGKVVDTRWEEPHVPCGQVVNKRLSVLVHGLVKWSVGQNEYQTRLAPTWIRHEPFNTSDHSAATCQ